MTVEEGFGAAFAFGFRTGFAFDAFGVALMPE